LGTELILFGGILDGLIDAIAWLLSPSNWWVILQVALGLGFVIFVHELGHFLVAKACGVKCEKFYIGFDIGGLKLFKKQ
jgi:regulator of sigma E protease